MEAVNPAINQPVVSGGGGASILWIMAVFLIILFGYIFYQSYVESRKNTPYIVDSKGKSGTEPLEVNSDMILKSSTGIQFSYMFFIRVDDMNYKYGKPKHILHFGNESGTLYCPGIWIYPEESNLFVRVNSFTKPTVSSRGFREKTPCDIKNLPIQRWVHVAVVLNNRTLDVYMDGVLKRSCELAGVPKIPEDAKLYVNQDGGFMGRISKMRYYNYAVNSNIIESESKSDGEEWALWSSLTSVGAPVTVSVSAKQYQLF